MSNVLTFRGGVKVADYKTTKECRIETLPMPSRLKIAIPDCRAEVSVGDAVLKYQVIGATDNPDLCPVHSPAEGTVSEVVTDEKGIVSVVIDVTGGNGTDPSVTPFGKKLSQASSDEIVGAVRRAGIRGSGKDSGPVHLKIREAAGRVRRVIVDCTGFDPMVSSVGRLVAENASEIINGTKIVMRALGVDRAVMAVGEKDADAVNILRERIGGSRYIRVAAVKHKYPQGDGRNLCRTVRGKNIPAGKSDIDCGCVSFNAETCIHVFRALAEGLPMTGRFITVDGDCVCQPKNLYVPFGTAFSVVFGYCGGLKKEPGEIIGGNVMTGAAGFTADSAVSPETEGVLVFSSGFRIKNGHFACIRCGRCVNVCPERLLPFEIGRLALKGRADKAVKIGLNACTECGACAYVCPGKVPIVGIIRAAKEENGKEEKAETETGTAAETGTEQVTETENGAGTGREPENGTEERKDETAVEKE